MNENGVNEDSTKSQAGARDFGSGSAWNALGKLSTDKKLDVTISMLRMVILNQVAIGHHLNAMEVDLDEGEVNEMVKCLEDSARLASGVVDLVQGR